MYKETILETQVFDLDWNRHVTSRTYENFAYAGRMDILGSLGFSVHEILAKKGKIITRDTTVRFLAQQFAGAKLKVRTRGFQDAEGLIHWNQLIEDISGNPVCDLKTNTCILDDAAKPMIIDELQIDPTVEHETKEKSSSESESRSDSESKSNSKTDSDVKNSHLDYHKLDIQMNDLPVGLKPLTHSMKVLFSDLNIFWSLSSVAIWKFFEEGRFLFFKKVLGFGSNSDLDITTFFMNANIQIYELPEAGTTITLESWIDSVEKIRFYFRQDLRDANGKLLASMRDEQLFIKLSASRPCRVPQEFLDKTEKFRVGS